MNEKILVTGGTGYISSHACVELLAAGREVVVLDNLANSSASVVGRIERIAGRRVAFVEGDVRDRGVLEALFARHPIGAVMHFAGLKAVGESAAKPLAYYDNNVQGSVVLAEAMSAHGVRTLVFSSSATVVERDARLAGDVSDWQEFGRFVRLMSALTAQEINFSQLGREIGMTPQTARRWLKVMQGTFQWFEIAAFSENALKRVSQRPKGYLAETGLACYHTQISSPRALGSHLLLGALFETAMACEIMKQAATLAAQPAFYHWRAAGGAEVDLLLERDGTLYPIEIELTANPTRRTASGILAFRAAHPQRRVANGIVLCAVEEPRWVADEVLAMPWNLAG